MVGVQVTTDCSVFDRFCFQCIVCLFPTIVIPFTLTFIISYIAVFIFSDYKNLYLPPILHVSPSLRRTSAPIQFTIVLGVLATQETLSYLVAGLFERDHLHPLPPTD